MKRFYRYRWIVIVIPYILAFIGYYEVFSNRANIDPRYILTSCLFESFKIYGMSVSVDLSEMRLELELARWLGALVTTTVIVNVIKHIATGIRLRWRLRKPDVVVVHGDGILKETILHSLDKSGLAASNELCFQADQHVIAFEQDKDALRYIVEHEKALFKPNKTVVFSSTDYEASDYLQSGLTVSNTAVNCARLYWQKHWLRDDNVRRVGIVGFGHFGHRLLEQALLVNVSPWHGPVEYHIYGSDGKDFLAWHPQLHHCVAINQSHVNMDSLHFHTKLEDMGLDHLQSMDRIILIMDSVDDNLLQLNYLLHAGVNGMIHIRCSKELLHRLQYFPDRETTQIVAFGDDDNLFSREVILHGKLTETAKAEHIFYVSQSKAENIRKKYTSCAGYAKCKNSGQCGDCPHIVSTWDDLTHFEKASSIAAADHVPVKRYLLKESLNRGGIATCKAALCQAEHTRWCRFYYLHNWQYSAKRDNTQRLHPCLMPFEKLTLQEQEKDWWGYENLLRNR